MVSEMIQINVWRVLQVFHNQERHPEIFEIHQNQCPVNIKKKKIKINCLLNLHFTIYIVKSLHKINFIRTKVRISSINQSLTLSFETVCGKETSLYLNGFT